MNSNLLPKILEVLRNGRIKLITNITVFERYDFYSSLFHYEKDKNGRQLTFDKYFIEWINEQIIEAFNTSNELGCYVVKYLSPIIKERVSFEENNQIEQMIPNLLKEKVKILESFMDIDELNETKLNKIKFMIEQDNAIFKRKMEEIQ